MGPGTGGGMIPAFARQHVTRTGGAEGCVRARGEGKGGGRGQQDEHLSVLSLWAVAPHERQGIAKPETASGAVVWGRVVSVRTGLTVQQERALLQIADMPSVRIAEQTCIRTAKYDPNEVTLGRAVADALLRAGAVEYVSYRRVKITAAGLSGVRRVTGGET